MSERSAELGELGRGQACGGSTAYLKEPGFLSVMGSYGEVLRKAVTSFDYL